MLNQLNTLVCSKCSPYLVGSLRGRNHWERITPLITQQGCNYSSKTSSTSSAQSSEVAVVTQKNQAVVETATVPQQTFISHFSGSDIRDLDPEARIKIHNVSAQVAAAQSATLITEKRLLKRRNILRMPEEEYAGYALLCRKPPLCDRQGFGQSEFMRQFEPVTHRTNTDVLCALQADIDMRPENIRRWYANAVIEEEMKSQAYNPKRNSILGNDLAAAHFVVFRKGKVKFLGQKEWVTAYRKDAKPETPEEDLPVMAFDLCTLPTKYDPRFRVEALDCTGVSLHYEGLANFENLRYVKWLSLRDSPYVDDWCMDKIARIFNETLEFLDLSGCKRVTDKGIGTFHRCKNLKAIVVDNMTHLPDLEIVCAMLEDVNPNLEILGVDYLSKMEKLRLEGDDFGSSQDLLDSNTTDPLAIESGSRPESDSKSIGHNPNLQPA
ncbi:unnamed protein product [Orchesella dallaii]|uniref:Mitochondrial ATP synthase regulatory component factor B n=1 Tax=Orchesella dallaii TaxID=48710 RepID=A0ABP1PYD5_9HEXA